ncbi:MAG: enterochelin esterase-like enzyme [Polyangiales bacterium]|jgi:enterochelin esterase-like enzyme
MSSAENDSDNVSWVPKATRFGRPLQGKIVKPILTSKCLPGALYQEPAERELFVYLPPGYEESGERYPVVLMLPAFFGTHGSAAKYEAFKPNSFERLDAQIAAGECRPVILVVPDAMTRFGGGQFVDSATSGLHQTHLAEEVIPFVDANFRTLAEAGGRGVVGRSSGGFGALRLAMDRPGLVAAVASHAGDAHFEVSMKPMLTSAAVAYHAAGGVRAFAERMDEAGPKGSLDFDGLIVMACSAAYAPNPSAGFPFCDLPFDAEGQIDGAGWKKWLENDPLVRIPRSASALRSLSTLFIDAGESDEHGLQFAARALHKALMAIDAPSNHEEHVGGHRGTAWRFDVSLPHVAGALVR